MAISCLPKDLVANARCLTCVPKEARRWVRTYLLCQLANAGSSSGGGGVIPTLPIVPTGFAFFAPDPIGHNRLSATWDTPPAGVATTEVWTSNDGVTYTLALAVAAPGTTDVTVSTLPAFGSVQWTKIRWCGAAGCSAFTSPLPISGQVADWMKRVKLNGAAAYPSNATVNSMSFFDNALINAGLDVMMLTANCFVPDSLIAALTPLYKLGGNTNDPWTNHGPFVAGDLTVNGLLGNGTTKYLDTGGVPSTFNNTANGAGGWFKYGLTLYLATGNNNNEQEIGGYSAVDNQIILYPSYGGNAQFTCPYAAGVDTVGPVANSAWTGYISGNRTKYQTEDGSGDARMYKASSTVAHAQIAVSLGAAVTNNNVSVPLFVFGTNGNGTPGTFSTKRLSFAAWHLALTAAQSLSFFQAIQALRVALNGGFV